MPEPVDRDRLADPATRVLDMETRAAVARTLRAMRPLHRQALVLREYGGLSCAAIGARLGLTPAAVKSLLFRARAEFRGLHRP